MSHGGRLEAFFTVPSGVSISVTNNGGGPTTVNIAAGSYTPTSFVAYLQSALTTQRAPSGGAWSVSLSTGPSGTGCVTIAMSSGTFSITWTSTLLRDLLGFTATISAQTSSTGPHHMRGLWLPKCPMDLEGDPDRAPVVTDKRESMSPTGAIIAVKGTRYLRHRRVRWTHVAQNRAWYGASSVAYEDCESWLKDTQLGEGHSWFSLASRFQLYYDRQGSDRIVGYDLNGGSGPTNGWQAPGISSVDQVITKAVSGWTGLWAVELPEIVSAG